VANNQGPCEVRPLGFAPANVGRDGSVRQQAADPESRKRLAGACLGLTERDRPEGCFANTCARPPTVVAAQSAGPAAHTRHTRGAGSRERWAVLHRASMPCASAPCFAAYQGDHRRFVAALLRADCATSLHHVVSRNLAPKASTNSTRATRSRACSRWNPLAFCKRLTRWKRLVDPREGARRAWRCWPSLGRWP
jgi:hypothetical protein